MRVVLIRSADTTWQAGPPTADESRMQGTVSLPLSEQGKVNVRRLAGQVAALRPHCLISSGNESSGPTAASLGELCGLKCRQVRALHEVDCGLWQGLRVSEIKARYAAAYRQWRQDPTSVRPPQGESVEEAASRVAEALLRLVKRYEDKTVIVVAGHLVAGVLECLLTGVPLSRLWLVADGPPTVRVLEASADTLARLGKRAAGVRRGRLAAVLGL